MPNYYTQIMPQFTPVSYQEYLDPLLRLQQRHDQLDEKLGTYSDNLEDIKSQLDPVKDAALITQINNYNEGLTNAATTLSTKGVMGIDRVALNNLRRGYKTEVNPIGVAAMRRQEAIKTHEADALAHPDKVYDYDVNDSAVTDFMNGATPRGKSFSTDTLYKQAATSAAAVSARKFFESEPGKALGNQYWKIFKTQGINSDTLVRFESDIRNNTDVNTANAVIQELRGIYNDTLKRNGLLTEDGEFDLVKEGSKIQASSAVLRGILDGVVYKEGSEYTEDKSYASPLQWANYNLSKREQDRADEQWKANPSNPNSPNYKKGSETDTPVSTENYYKMRGTKVNVDKDMKFKKEHENLNNLYKALQSIANGKEPSQYIQETVYTDPTMNTLNTAMLNYMEKKKAENPDYDGTTDPQVKVFQDQIKARKNQLSSLPSAPSLYRTVKKENPEWKAWNDAKKKYGTEDVNELAQKALQDYNHKIYAERYTILDINANGLALGDIYQDLFANLDLSKSKDRKSAIRDSKDKVPDAETVDKLFHSADTEIGYNFVTGKAVIVNPSLGGTYYIDATRAFHNIKVQGMPLDEYFEAVSKDLALQTDPESALNTTITYNNISNGYKAMYNYYNSGNPEASKTSSKVTQIPPVNGALTQEEATDIPF